MQARNTGNADEMERLIRESEMRKQGGAETIVVNNNNIDQSQRSETKQIQSTTITDPAAMAGSAITS